MTKAVVFFPQNPIPSRSGFHRRGLQMLSALRELGVDTILASSQLSAGNGWNAESVATLTANYVSSVQVHSPSPADLRIVDTLKRAYRRFGRTPPVSSWISTPPGMRRWFARLVAETGPEIVMMNYAIWDGLIDHGRLRKVRRIIDTIDTVTLNKKMWGALAAALPPAPIDPLAVDETVIELDFFTKLDLKPDAAEFKIYDRYTDTIAITPREAKAFKSATSKTTVIHIPMTQEVKPLKNTYAGPALFATGPNPFNIQAYVFLARRVLPEVLRHHKDFMLLLTGQPADAVKAVPGVSSLGFVDDLAAIYEQAAFAVCPVFGLTGQQVKIVEAMAHGVPVIALKTAAERSPIEHEVNGLVAESGEEFAEHVRRLWSDRSLCRRLGAEARLKIQNEFSSENVRTAMQTLLR